MTRPRTRSLPATGLRQPAAFAEEPSRPIAAANPALERGLRIADPSPCLHIAVAEPREALRSRYIRLLPAAHDKMRSRMPSSWLAKPQIPPIEG
jgi:hypothetical protein